MIPYSDFMYFAILLLALLPTIIGGFYGKRMWSYNSIITFIMLALIFGPYPTQWIGLLLYMIGQVAIMKGYVLYRQRYNESIMFYMVIVLSLFPLVAVKILPILSPTTLIGFLGISYVTFKAVQVLIDIRDGQIKEMRIRDYVLFLLHFPTITSGPIDRYKRFKKDLDTTLSRETYSEYVYEGMNKIFLGFLYKFIIGYWIYTGILQSEFVASSTFWADVTYMYSYSFYLFFDFAGYSAFAIGTSYIMGIRTPENFNKPFLSRNIKDFWNRWHISLSFWFRDYVYMRLVFLLTKKKVIKNRFVISYIGYFTLFFLMGIWHGLALHFIVYGLYHALMITCFDWFERKNKKLKFWPKNTVTHVIGVIITFHVICFGFYIFSGQFI